MLGFLLLGVAGYSVGLHELEVVVVLAYPFGAQHFDDAVYRRTAAHAAGTAGNLDVDVVAGPVCAFEQCSLKAKWIMLAISSV